MKCLLVETVAQLQLGLCAQRLHLVIAVVVGRGLPRNTVRIALDFVLRPGQGQVQIVSRLPSRLEELEASWRSFLNGEGVVATEAANWTSVKALFD